MAYSWMFLALRSCRQIFWLNCMMFAALFSPAFGQPFALQGPGVNSNEFRITTFASGLDFPLGMARLSDDSLLVAVSQGPDFFKSTGKLIRLVDTNKDGVADGPGTALYTNLPGSQTAVRVVDSLVFATGQTKPITVLRAGASPSNPLTFIGRIGINYGGAWYHPNSALGIRRTPGRTNRYDLIFQIGSDSNNSKTTRTAMLTNENIPGATGALAGDSAYMLTIADNGTGLTATNLTQIGAGLRNPAGFAFQPATGDLFLQDNGIDGLVDPDEPLSADELNLIARTNLGKTAVDFGYPSNYTAYRSGTIVGPAGVSPIIAFQPVPDPFTGLESEGANDIIFAPPAFPMGLNTGIFIGFHGKYNSGGANNEENPLVYANPATGSYFHFIRGQQPGIGHLDGLLSTRDSLFVADLVATGNPANGAGAGIIYQIMSLATPVPPTLGARFLGPQIELTWDRGALQETDDVTGEWHEVVDAFSPHLVPLNGPRKFYRTGY
jgi:glucose/arabinose dehydrogenase